MAFESSAENLDFLAEGGRGIVLMRSLVDDVEFATTPGVGTVVSLTKRLNLRHDALLSRFVDREPQFARRRGGGLFFTDIPF
jgi:hypothetical protein